MGIPRLYRQSGDPTLVNYNFTELASGLGYVTLYLSDVLPSNTYILTSNTSYSVSGAISIAGTDSLTMDFSTTINLPLMAKGKALINLGTQIYSSSGTLTPDREYTFYIKKNSTTLVSGATTVDYGSIGVGATQFKNIALPLTIPATKFDNGDTLTLTITTTGGQAAAVTFIGVDPANRAYTDLGAQSDTGYTASKFYLPIKADL